jgi:hypothetical protein
LELSDKDVVRSERAEGGIDFVNIAEMTRG